MSLPLRLIATAALCATLSGCVWYSRYPKEWPKMAAAARQGCLDVSGHYANKAYNNNLTLGDLLVKHFLGYRYFNYPADVQLSQSDQQLEVVVRKDGATVGSTTLTFGKELSCSDGELRLASAGAIGGGAFVGYQNINTRFNLAEDGSLVLHTRSFETGLVVFIPVGGVTYDYYRFVKSPREVHQEAPPVPSPTAKAAAQ